MATVAVKVQVDTRPARQKLSNERERALAALRTAVAQTARAVEKDLEAQTRTAATGRLWRAWASEVFPRRGVLASNPSAMVFPKGAARTRGALRALAFGGRIRAARGQFMAIPLPAAGKVNRRAPTPEEFEAKFGIKLQFVPRGGGKAPLLVAEGRLSGATSTRGSSLIARRQFVRGKGRFAVGKRRTTTTVPVFVLVPIVNQRQKISLRSALLKARPSMKKIFELQRRFGARPAARRGGGGSVIGRIFRGLR